MGERAEVREEEICPISWASSAITQNCPSTPPEREGSVMLFALQQVTKLCRD